jgi:F0F1-type ATP synthase delta subunit
MNYTSRQYAAALFDALADKEPAQRREILTQFLKTLDKNHDSHSLKRILVDYEKVFLKKQGMRKVDIESASPITEVVRTEIEKTLGKKILLTEKVNPELIAGLTLLVDDTAFIDASARTQINTLL